MSESPDTAPAAANGTDIDAEELDVEEGAGAADADVPASSDPDAFVDDPTLGGTGGGSAGGAG